MENCVEANNKNKLYHYTTVETLALILKSKKIRFNSLENLDDLLENKTEEFNELGSYYFVSCFSNDNEESIPIWSMYSQNGQGVRLEFSKPLFDECFKIDDEIKGEVEVKMKGPFEIEYTNEEDKLIPKIIRKQTQSDPSKTSNDTLEDGAGTQVFGVETKTYSYADIGRCKLPNWKFQSEVRYMIDFVSKELKESIREDNSTTIKRCERKYCDIPIKEDALKNLTI